MTYDTIKSVDPSARVLAPAVSGVGTTDEWLDAIPADKYDILAIHLYTEPDFLNDRRYSYYDQGLPNLAAVVARHGNKPVWITEFGFSSQGGAEGWYVGDEGAQARYLVQQVAETLAFTGDLKIERIMPYVFNDHDGFELVHGWTNPKPAYAAFQTLSAQLAGATPVGRVDAGAGVFAFRFIRDNRQVDIIWSPGGGTAALPSNGDAEVYTIGGSRSVVGRTGAEVRIRSTSFIPWAGIGVPSPVLVNSSSKPRRELPPRLLGNARRPDAVRVPDLGRVRRALGRWEHLPGAVFRAGALRVASR